MTDVPDYRYWTADAIRASRSGGPDRGYDDVPERPFADEADARHNEPHDDLPDDLPEPLPEPLPDDLHDDVPDGPAVNAAPHRSPLIRPFAAFAAEVDLSEPVVVEAPRPASDPPPFVREAPPVAAAPPPPPEVAPELSTPKSATPEPSTYEPSTYELPLEPSAPGPLRRVARPAAPPFATPPVHVPNAFSPAEPPAYAPAYRSGYGPQLTTFPAVRLPDQPVRRRGSRKPLLVLSYLVVIALAAFATHLYWPKHDHPSTIATGSTASGVLYTSATGHFRARFAALPTPAADKDTVLGTSLRLHGAVDAADHMMVTEAELSRPLPQTQYAAFLTGVLHGAAAAGATLRSEHATTFRGHTARLGAYTVTADGSPLSILAFVASSSRAYVILAPTGSAMTALEQSFVALP